MTSDAEISRMKAENKERQLSVSFEMEAKKIDFNKIMRSVALG